jgi:hypothetical protein
MVRSFESGDDVRLLRECLKALLREQGLSHAAFINEVRGSKVPRKSSETAGRSTLQMFLKGDDLSRSIATLRGYWDFIGNHPVYHSYLVRLLAAPTGPDLNALSEQELLAVALDRFFSDGPQEAGVTKINRLRDKILGSYVMYMADMRALVNPPQFTGLIRASEFTLWRSGEAIQCEEKQDFKKCKRGPKHQQLNSGVLFSYSEKLIFLMRGEGEASCKFGVIEKMKNWVKGPLEWFAGSVFPFSDSAVFPTERFCCLRNEGELKTGYLLPKEIGNYELRGYFRAPRTIMRF